MTVVEKRAIQERKMRAVKKAVSDSVVFVFGFLVGLSLFAYKYDAICMLCFKRVRYMIINRYLCFAVYLALIFFFVLVHIYVFTEPAKPWKEKRKNKITVFLKNVNVGIMGFFFAVNLAFGVVIIKMLPEGLLSVLI